MSDVKKKPIEHGILHVRRVEIPRAIKSQIFDIFLGDIRIAQMGRQSANWSGRDTKWYWIKGLAGKGVYDSSAIRRTLDRLAILVNGANLHQGSNFALDLGQGDLRQWKSAEVMNEELDLSPPKITIGQNGNPRLYTE